MGGISPIKILIACEFSGVVRDAFRSKGHEAYSCDLEWNESPYHIQEDVLEILEEGWDMMIAHPPCTCLTVAGNRWYADRPDLIQEAFSFVMQLADAPIEKIAVENPIGRLSTLWRKPDQIIQPWQFGHGETKATCLWLKNLPKLVPTDIVEGREQRIWKLPPSKDRSKIRSITYKGIAEAMADQWGGTVG